MVFVPIPLPLPPQMNRPQLDRPQFNRPQRNRRQQRLQRQLQDLQHYHALIAVMPYSPAVLQIVRVIQFVLKLARKLIFNASHVVAMAIVKPPPLPQQPQAVPHLQQLARQQHYRALSNVMKT